MPHLITTPALTVLVVITAIAIATAAGAAGDDLCGRFLERDRQFVDDPPNSIRALDLVDIDQDGINDLITSDPLVNIRWGQGDGTFTAPEPFDAFAIDFAFADMDGDGLKDVIILKSFRLEYLRWLGGRQFAPAVLLTDGLDRARAVVVGDLDDDDDTDVVVAAAQIFTPMSVFLNEGGGVLGPPAHPDTNAARDGALADFDGDGDLDYASRDNIGATIHFNDGTGVFVDPRVRPFDNSLDARVIAADIDRDGDIDLATTGNGFGGTSFFYILRNNGTGPFGILRLHSSRLPLALGDFDGDRDLDVVTADSASAETLQVHWNIGGLEFVEGPTLTNFGINLAAGQIDDDGDVDIVAVIRGAGSANDEFARYDNLCRLCAGDLDGNERVDVADLLLVLANWAAEGGPADANADGIVNFADLLLVLAHWGGCDPPTGACCSRDGDAYACAVMSEAFCSALKSSAYRGDDTSCEADTCMGGCCIEETFACDTMSLDVCAAAGGTFLGIGVSCAVETCPAAFVAACCLPVFACCEPVTEDDCAAMGGAWKGLGRECSACVPELFACCLPDGTCAELAPVDCIDQGGTFEGCVPCKDLDC